jgi:polysaccharide export outer membrane protein
LAANGGIKMLPAIAITLAFLFAMAGCSSTSENYPVFQQTDVNPEPTKKPEAVVLREGDILRITFPGAPALDATPQIRRDGKITLSLVGEINAVGMTVNQLEKELVKLYSSQLVTKEVTVMLVSSTFDVYVTGAVFRPGKVISNRPLTALEAIMEAGGPDYTKANLKAVDVIRTSQGRTEHFKLNLKRVLNGQDSEPFFLKPSDVVYVPERFAWF